MAGMTRRKLALLTTMVLLTGGLVLATLVCIFGLSESSDSSPARENIIFIMADDLGWNDVGYNGMTQIPTPNLDALAAHGVVLSSYYGAPMCTPSRASLMTGRYPSHLGLQHYVIPENGPWGLPLGVPTLTDKLKELGYVCRGLGKWHLGFYKSEYLPGSRGFDSHLGFWTGSLDYFEHTSSSSGKRWEYTNVPENVTEETISFRGYSLRENDKERKDLQGLYLTDLLTEQAVEIISSHNSSKPLFLYLAHHAPHRGNTQKPVTAPEKYTKEFSYIQDITRKNFAGSLSALDKSVGMVIEALATKGMLENCLVVFASDNGADFKLPSANGGSNWPLRGQKTSGWEGGVRIPALVWSPRIEMPGREWSGLMHATDWLPTLYRFAGSEPRTLKEIDGHDMWKAISENLPSQRKEVLLLSDPIWKMSALRVGDFKIINGSFPESDLDGWYGPSGRQEEIHLLEKTESSVFRLLSKYSRNRTEPFKTPKVLLNCGEKPTNPSQECDLKREVCVFNIKDDPCEYRNIAKENEELLKLLAGRLREYESRQVAPLNTKRDYLANPDLHNGSWVQWRDDM